MLHSAARRGLWLITKGVSNHFSETRGISPYFFWGGVCLFCCITELDF